MKKFTAFKHNCQVGQITQVPEKFVVLERKDQMNSIGLRDTNCFQSSGLTVFNVVLFQKNLPKAVYELELKNRTEKVIEDKGLTGNDLQVFLENTAIDIISDAFSKVSTHKIYMNNQFMLIEATGKQCDLIWKFLKELLTELTNFSEFKIELVKVEQTQFVEKYISANATKITCKLDEENAMSLKGSDLISDEHEAILKGELKQFSSRTDNFEYTVNNKLVFSGIKFMNELESEEDSIDLERSSYLFPFILEWLS
jgi:hypothetical protein